MQKLRDPGVIVAVTLSRQSVASIGVASKLTPQEVTTKLAAGLRSLGAKLVLNAGAGQDLALMEAAAEFMERYRAQHSMPTGTLKGLTEVLLFPYFVKSKAISNGIMHQESIPCPCLCVLGLMTTWFN